VPGGEEHDDSKDEEKRDEDGDCFDEEESATARGGADNVLAEVAVKGGRFGCFRLVVIHALFQRINAGRRGL